MNPFLEAAISYAAKGWPVFPCKPTDKRPLTAAESSPGAKDGGLYLATCEPAQIRKWWEQFPKAMIGVPTGAKIGAVVVDLDPKLHAADVMLKTLQAWLGGGALTPGPVSRTQSGGLHLFYAMAGEKLGNRAGLFSKIADAPEELRSHVDVRGDGGYVIVPPSIMASGKAYCWEQEPDGELPPLPEKLLDAIAKRGGGDPPQPEQHPITPRVNRDDAVSRARHKYAMAAIDREISGLSRAVEGQRGFELNKVGYSLGGLVGAGLVSATLIRAELFSACEQNGLAGKDGVKKCRDNIARAVGQGAAKPLDLSQIGTRAGTSRRASGSSAAPLEPPPADPSVPPPEPSDGFQEDPASQPGWAAKEHRDGGEGAPHELWLANLPMTDLGNAQRFMARYGRDFLYVEEWGWMAWDGRRWIGREAGARAQRAVHDTIKAIAEEAHQVRLYSMGFDNDADMTKRVAAFKARIAAQFINPVLDVKKDGTIVTFADRLANWCLVSQNNSRVTPMANLAQHYLTSSPDAFDADPGLLNVQNGTLRFARADDGDYVSFHPHRRQDFATKISPTAFDRHAVCPIYDGFLAEVQPDPGMRRHLHAWGGVSLTGLPLAKMSFWHGLGRNGKGTAAEAWAYVAGDYSQSIPVESFLDQGRTRRGAEATPDIAKLPGVRLLRTSEPGRNAKFDEGLIKLLTGGDRISTRHLNREFFEFLPVFKLTMQGNHRPRIEGVDRGIWSRIFLVPWLVSIADDKIDLALPEKLRGEASGILNHLLDGLRDYLDHGLSPTEDIMASTAEYREDSDPIGRFLTECTITVAIAEDARVAAKPLYGLYDAWARAMGEKPWSPKAFSNGLRDHGIVRLKSSGNFYRHLRMTRLAAEFEGEEIGLFKDKER